MRVRCTQLIEASGPKRGQRRASHPSIVVGEEYVVLSVMIDGSERDPWKVSLQILEPDGRPVWRPGRMFETTDTTVPSNWTVELWNDGSLHMAPASWLREGYWEDFWKEGPDSEAAKVFKRQLAVILDEGGHAS